MCDESDFGVFQDEFLKRKQQFGLNGYKTYFKTEPISDAYADITVNQDSMCATVRLTSLHTKGDKKFFNPKKHAQHEALHLLTYRLENLALSRYVTPNEIEQTCEELVIKLEGLIKW